MFIDILLSLTFSQGMRSISLKRLGSLHLNSATVAVSSSVKCCGEPRTEAPCLPIDLFLRRYFQAGAMGSCHGDAVCSRGTSSWMAKIAREPSLFCFVFLPHLGETISTCFKLHTFEWYGPAWQVDCRQDLRALQAHAVKIF